MEGIGSSCGFLEPMTVVVKNSKDIYFNELYDYCSGDDCSFFTGVYEVEVEKLYVFPQPALTNLSFQISQANQLGDLFIYNCTGQLMQKTKIQSDNNLFTIDISQYTSGIYFYKYLINKQILSGKFIKN